MRIRQVTCPACRGVGRLHGLVCVECRATGLLAWDESGNRVPSAGGLEAAWKRAEKGFGRSTPGKRSWDGSDWSS